MKIHTADDHKLWYDKEHEIATFRFGNFVYFVDGNQYASAGFDPEKVFILYILTKSKQLQQEFWQFQFEQTLPEFVEEVCSILNETRSRDGRNVLNQNFDIQEWDSKKDGWNYPQDKKLYMCNMIF